MFFFTVFPYQDLYIRINTLIQEKPREMNNNNISLNHIKASMISESIIKKKNAFYGKKQYKTFCNDAIDFILPRLS